MKTIHICIITLACLMAGRCLAQNRIVLKDSKVLENARYNATHGGLVEYEQNGSLHDVELENIAWIEKDGPMHWRLTAGDTFTKDSVETQSAVTQGDSPTERNHQDRMISGEHRTVKAIETPQLVLVERTDGKTDYQQGFADAKNYFHAPGSTILGFFSLPALFIFPVGTAAAVGVDAVNISNCNPQAYTSSTNAEYLNGYKKGMGTKKLNNILIGAGIFGGTVLVGGALLLATLLVGH